MNDHDTLTNLILDCEETGASPRETADYLIERGVRLPAPVVTDPDELPPGSIVLRDGVAWHRDAGYWHLVCGGHARWDSPFGPGSITVVYIPS